VTQNIPDAAIVIQNTKEPPLTMTVNLTSPLVREEAEKAEAGGKAVGRTLPTSRAPLATTLAPLPRRETNHAGRQGGRKADRQTGIRVRQILFIGPSMELARAHKKCKMTSELCCHGYSPLDTLVVPYDVTLHF